MGRYISAEAVIVRLRGKVKTTDNPEENPDRLSLELLNRLINEAEGQVEWDLSSRYAAPFQGYKCEPFERLPERPTREMIRTLCELMAVVRVLETDFGRGSAVDASRYADASQTRYTKMIDSLTQIREGSYNTFSRPPLPGLRPNYHVSAADNGFSGFVGRTDDHTTNASAAQQINDPSMSYWNAYLDNDLQRDWTQG